MRSKSTQRETKTRRIGRSWKTTEFNYAVGIIVGKGEKFEKRGREAKNEGIATINEEERVLEITEKNFVKENKGVVAGRVGDGEKWWEVIGNRKWTEK